ncbi:hypothetical protein BUE93_11145 [Chromobacterium amazonense]|uniref:Uncharacterized protein n=1 Tax=Chromobacterium amazonense TaxID=1382803 RepID=A0A2S9X526_9NEIS|nr:hypothetical protein BUE93_11145 [Chromobacterium amazonense]
MLHQAGIISVLGITASIDDALRQVGKWIVSLLSARFWAGRLMGMQSHSLMFGRRACAGQSRVQAAGLICVRHWPFGLAERLRPVNRSTVLKHGLRAILRRSRQ